MVNTRDSQEISGEKTEADILTSNTSASVKTSQESIEHVEIAKTPLPQENAPLPQENAPLPQEDEPLPQEDAPLPHENRDENILPNAENFNRAIRLPVYEIDDWKENEELLEETVMEEALVS